MEKKTIEIPEDFSEHLLNCPANQKFIGELTPHYTRRRYGKRTVFTWVHFTDEDGNLYTPQYNPYRGKRPKGYIKCAKSIVQKGHYYENQS